MVAQPAEIKWYAPIDMVSQARKGRRLLRLTPILISKREETLSSSESANGMLSAAPSLQDDYQDDGIRALTRLEQLNCFAVVKNMLEGGESVPNIAKFIREEAKESLDISEKSLRNRLYRYIQKNSRETVREQVPRPHLALYQKQVEKIDAVAALQLLGSIHMDRILMEYAVEKKIGKTIISTTSAIKVANDIYRTIHEIETDLKNQGVQPQQTSLEEQMAHFRERYREQWGEAWTNIALNPESRRRIVGAMEKVRRWNSTAFLEAVKAKRESLGIKDDPMKCPTCDK